MRVEVVTPEDYMGDVIGDLNSEEVKLVHKNKRKCYGDNCNGTFGKYVWVYQQFKIHVSRACSIFNVFDHYSKVPQNVQDEVTKKVVG